METNAEKLAVARECLNYLGELPDRLRQAPRGARRHSGETAITLGNWLLWIAPKLEPTAPPCYKQLAGEPDSVAQLGRRFREVGLELWNQPDAALAAPDRDFDNRVYQALDEYLSGLALRKERK